MTILASVILVQVALGVCLGLVAVVDKLTSKEG